MIRFSYAEMKQIIAACASRWGEEPDTASEAVLDVIVEVDKILDQREDRIEQFNEEVQSLEGEPGYIGERQRVQENTSCS